LSGAAIQTIEALEKFGFHLGMTFQIIDDLLDLTSTSKILGKPAGNDINEGNYTLPVIFSLQDNSEIREMLQDPIHLNDILKIVKHKKYVDPTKEIALEHVNLATDFLNRSEINREVKQSFLKLLKGLTQRTT
ncbi:MAG: polyprenyl synthetase family protein, partial [Acidimicrobiia bacterium]